MTQVLVVDDDEDIRATISLLLEEAGYRAVEAADGAVALELLRASDEGMVVLLDLHMPRVDGIEVLTTVAGQRALSARHAYIVVTANARTLPLRFVELLQQFHVPIIAKPFDIDTLLESVAVAEGRLAAR